VNMEHEELHQWGLMDGPQAYIKRDMSNREVDGSIIDILNIWKDLIPCTWMLGIVYEKDMHNHPIDHCWITERGGESVIEKYNPF
jgi:hypothetical protein